MENAKIEYIPLSKIKANPENPRVVKDAGFAKLKRSIAQFPQMLAVRGLAVVKEGDKYITIGGNQRYRALCDVKDELSNDETRAEYGMSDEAFNTLIGYFSKGVPCVDCTSFTPDQVRRFVVADNISAGEWDTDELANGWDMSELTEWGMPQWVINSGDDDDDQPAKPKVGIGTKIEVLIVDPAIFDRVMADIQDAIGKYPGVVANAL